MYTLRILCPAQTPCISHSPKKRLPLDEVMNKLETSRPPTTASGVLLDQRASPSGKTLHDTALVRCTNPGNNTRPEDRLDRLHDKMTPTYTRRTRSGPQRSKYCTPLQQSTLEIQQLRKTADDIREPTSSVEDVMCPFTLFGLSA